MGTKAWVNNIEEMTLRSQTCLIGFFVTFLFSIPNFLQAQLVINEVMASNSITLLDEDGTASDWIELYNAGSTSLNLEGYGISDRNVPERFWIFPTMDIGPNEYLLIFASDKDRRQAPIFWETIIDQGDHWKYLVPQSEPASNWRSIDFDDSGWSEGPSGFGYGDNDDNTIIDRTMSVFIRKSFTIDQLTDVYGILLHIDFDDGFVAYINGTEVARSNMSYSGKPPYNSPAATDREAVMYRGGFPDVFDLANFMHLLIEGDNVISIQVHNNQINSSDLTAIPFLSLGRRNNNDLRKSQYIDIKPTSLHTNFKIGAEGETIYLADASGELIDTVFTGKQRADISFGKVPDGGEEWYYFIEPTPGKSNTTQGFQNISGEVVFSHEGGIYNQAFHVNLTTENASDLIYYTTDGSVPTNLSTPYSSPISINKTTVVRARTFNDNSIPSETTSHTFLYNPNHNIAIISISTNPENLWDYNEGIYVMGPNASNENPHFGANFWMDWEKPIHIEMYEPNGTKAFGANAGVKIFGGWSRAHAQKSFAIHFRKSYGSGPINYKMFPNLDLTEFSSMVLRNSGNDWNNTMIRDAVLTSLFHKEVEKQAYRPAAIYLNGEYWGILNIREKINEDYLGSHHNIKPDDITMLESNAVPIEGDPENYVSMIDYISKNDLAVQSHYEYIKTQMDVFNFIQYQIGQIYIDNTDWPGNNIKYWRGNGPTDKWRWIVYDTDFGFGIWDLNGRINYNTLSFALQPNGPNWPNPPWSTFLLRNLIKNQEFKNLFINAFADRLNTEWLPANVKNRISSHRNGISSEIQRHLTRWGGNYNYWNSQINNMNTFADGRPNNVRNHIRTQFGLSGTQTVSLDVNNSTYGSIGLNTIVPGNYPWSGIYFTGVPITLQAMPKPGHRFVRWEGSSTSADPKLTIQLSSSFSVKAIFEKVIIDATSVVINEINYKSGPDFDPEDWIELYNKADYNIDMTGWILKDDNDNHQFIFPTNTVIQAYGYLIVCRDKKKFSALFPNVTNVFGDMDFGLGSDGDCVRLYNQQMQKVDEVCYLGVSPWPEEANGQGATLALIHYNYDNSLPENWYALHGNGNPGQRNSLITGTDDPTTNNWFQAYPNPVTDHMIINLELDRPNHISVMVYDLKGKLLSKILEGTMTAGRHEQVWIPESSIPHGIYIIKAITDHDTRIVKAVLN